MKINRCESDLPKARLALSIFDGSLWRAKSPETPFTQYVLRENYCRQHRDINTVADLKAPFGLASTRLSEATRAISSPPTARRFPSRQSRKNSRRLPTPFVTRATTGGGSSTAESTTTFEN